MTPTEQPQSITPIYQSSDNEVTDVTHPSNPPFDEMHTSTSTKTTTNGYSPAPGAHDSHVLYSPSSYNQHSTGVHHHHHQTAILSSPPPFLLSTTVGSPSLSSPTSSYSSHYQHYTNNSNFALTSLVPQAQQPPPSPSHHAMRTVYLGNLAPDTPISDILNQVRSGVLESARLLAEKNCVFLTFVDASAATHFYQQVSHRPLTLNGMELKIGWGKPSEVPQHLRLALQNGASRNVFLGSLDDTVNEEGIREDLKRFGTIEHVRVLGEKKIAFVHFLSIADAIKCVNQLPNHLEWQNRRIYYGRDRCCPNVNAAPNSLPTPPSPSYYRPYYSPHHPIHVQHHAYQVRYPSSFAYDPYTGATVEQVHHHHHHHHQPSAPAHVILPSPMVPALATSMHGDTTNSTTGSAIYPHPYAAGNPSTHSLEGVANRTVYLGNIHPETTCEDICNVVRGGILSQIRYIVDKHIAFLVFVDPAQALQFYTQANAQGMVIKSRRLKIGWGKPSSLPGNIIQAVHSGGSRNVYLGNMDTMDEDKLKHDFSEYGDIELVNTLKEKNCAFINFTSIAAAIRAIEGIRTKEEYKRFRINYGKDRCGNPPRPPGVASLQKTTLQQPVESTTSSSSSTTNSVTTPPTSCSNIAHAPPTIANQDGLLSMVDTAAAPTLGNGLEIMPTTFSTSSNSYDMAPLSDLMADLNCPDIQ